MPVSLLTAFKVALRLLKHLCQNEKVVDLVVKLKIYIFVIMSFERSEKLALERGMALNLLIHVIHVEIDGCSSQ